MGNLKAHIQALPHHRVTDNHWKIWEILWDGGNQQWWACNFPRSLITLAASLLQPPQRLNYQRDERDSSSMAVIVMQMTFTHLRHRKSMAWVTAALLMVSCWTGDTTVTSRAADRPLFQQGRKISAGWLLEPGIYKGRVLLLRG